MEKVPETKYLVSTTLQLVPTPTSGVEQAMDRVVKEGTRRGTHTQPSEDVLK